MPDAQAPIVTPIELGFVNAYLVQGEHPILVDAGMPGDTEAILKALREAHVEPEGLRLLLVTHGHTDHFGGLAELRAHTEAPVAVHRADAEALRRGTNPPLTPTGVLGRLMKPLAARAEPAPVKPDIELEGHEPLARFGVDGRLVPTPGHTPGSITVELPTGACLVGDLIARSLRKTTPGLPPFAEDVGQIRESLAALLEREPTRLYAGHGGPFDPDVVRRRLL